MADGENLGKIIKANNLIKSQKKGEDSLDRLRKAFLPTD